MSSSRSKVEYLTSRYALDTDRDPKKEKKAKKEKKKKHSKNDRDDPKETRRSNRDLRLYDDDHLESLDVAGGKSHPEEDSNDEVEEEDAPVVVESADWIEPNNFNRGKHTPRGAWEVESLHDANEADSPQVRRVRRRHDSSSDEDAPPSRRRHDSSDEDVPPPRRRHDSSSEEDAPPRRKRHDSSSEEDAPPRRRRHDSDDSSRHRTNDDSRRKRQDSESSGERRIPEASRAKRRRDSSDSDSASRHHRRRTRYDSDDNSDDETGGRERMSSGHRSGIQTGQDFSRREKRLQHTKREVTQAFVEKHGGTGETVHRDRNSGAIIDPKQQAGKQDKKVVLSAEEQRKLNVGQAQLEREAQAKREFAALQEASFARTKDDADLDAMLKSVIHADDPMAAYAMEQQQKQTSVVSGGENGAAKVTSRPRYKGPPAKPNRFGIPPGYRWDARDRGNGFEDKLLAQKYNAQHQKEKAYRYSAADM